MKVHTRKSFSSSLHRHQQYEAPQGEVESSLAGLWQELLRVERVGRHDDFIELGGHSLLAVHLTWGIRAKLGVQVSMAEVLEHRVLSALAEAVQRASQGALPPITIEERGEIVPLLLAQQRMWFATRLPGDHGAYHIPHGWRLVGPLDRAALRRALDRLVARHESLRTTFRSHEGVPMQCIGAEDCGFTLIEHDLRGDMQAAPKLDAWMVQEAETPFDVEQGPLIRGRLIELSDGECVLLITMHHIVSDGWSLAVLQRELSVLYAAFRRGQSDPLAPLPIQYVDYVLWQRRWLSSEELHRQGEYWQRTLSGAPALLTLPTDRPRPSRQSFAAASVKVELDEELSAALKRFNHRHGTTLFMTILTAWAAVLSRLSGQQEVVIGTPVANRRQPEVAPLIGFFVNTLALRVDVSGGATVRELLQRVKSRALAAQEHQDLPFEQVVERVKPIRNLAHSAVFQVMFVWQNNDQQPLTLPDLAVSEVKVPYAKVQLDLLLSLAEQDGRIAGELSYATALFEHGTIERHLGYLRTLLQAMLADDEQPIDRVALLGVEERDQVLRQWNATTAKYPSARCIHELFEEQVQRTPQAVAVVHADAQLTYREINVRANRLAHHLRSAGVGPEERVALCVRRGLEMVVGMLGILKAGGAYVPLDPEYPRQRLQLMLEDVTPRAVVTQERLKGMLPATDVPIVTLDDICEPTVASDCGLDLDPVVEGLTPRHLAYVIYTSGSTGRPKGVAIEHGSFVASLHKHMAAFPLAAATFLQRTSISFDVVTWELYWPLLTGGKTVILDSSSASSAADILASCRKHRIGICTFVPSQLHMILEEIEQHGEQVDLQYVFCGGERLDTALAKRFVRLLPDACLVNCYGPTESTAGIYNVLTGESVDRIAASTPIGRRLDGTKVYVLDPQRQPVPIGVAGEIYIGGEGLARGYWNLPQLTAERFVADPFSDEADARIYKSGDLGRYLPDGALEFLGRDDQQVKLRGFRIELGEIEARLHACGGVREGLVIVREDVPGDKRLVAYLTTQEGVELSVGQLRTELAAALPEHMLPGAFVIVPVFPMTPNGKVDRAALPIPAEEAYRHQQYEAPQGEVESLLAGLWQDVLRVERVGRHDDFFELGGHSLLAVRLTWRIQQVMGVQVNLLDLFDRPVLSELAEMVQSAKPSALPPITAIRATRGPGTRGDGRGA